MNRHSWRWNIPAYGRKVCTECGLEWSIQNHRKTPPCVWKPDAKTASAVYKEVGEWLKDYGDWDFGDRQVVYSFNIIDPALDRLLAGLPPEQEGK